MQVLSFSSMMRKFFIAPPRNPVASCLLTVLQHRECMQEVGGFGNKPEIKMPETNELQACL